MKIGAIIQARMNSNRLPGKTLHEVAGKSMLQYLLERLFRCNLLDKIIVATSIEKDNDAIEAFCMKEGVTCYRGSEENVASRFLEIIDSYEMNFFIRVNGDSPLLDQRLIEKGVNFFLNGDFNLVTNVYPRTYPKGQSVEVIKSDTFRQAYNLMRKPEEFEHITKYFYAHENYFKIFNFESGSDYGEINLSIDTQKDMDNFAKVVFRMNKPHWEYAFEDVLGLYEGLTPTDPL